MTAEQFAYWLQGFVELNPDMAMPAPEQWKSICEHLQTVFVKVTPPVPSFKQPTMTELAKRLREAQTPGFPAISWPAMPQITC